MAFKTLYTSSFGSVFYRNTVNGHLVSLFIQQDTEDDVSSEEISLTYDSPVTIEWAQTEKHEPVQGATCQVRIICESDRKFLPLYNTIPGSVRLVINGSNIGGHFSGTLDTETYEEPYATAEGYVVTLTFVDFGYLNRIDFDMRGHRTLYEIIESAILKSNLSILGITDDTTTRKEENGSERILSQLSVNCENFYDEDGGPMTYKEVLESILQPLGARIIQRGRVIFVYDFHSLFVHNALHGGAINWMGEDQTLQLDKYYNKITISLSTYSDSQMSNDDMNLPFDFSLYKYNINRAEQVDFPIRQTPCKYISYYNSLIARDMTEEGVSFTLFWMSGLTPSQVAKMNVVYNFLSSIALPFKINPIGGGEECEGFISHFKTGRAAYGDVTPNVVDGTPLFICKTTKINKLNHPELYNLRLSMEMLVDYRYNPFNATDDNNVTAVEAIMPYKYYSHTFKPIKVELLDDEGNVKKVYSNAPYLDKLCNYEMTAWLSDDWRYADYDREDWRASHSWYDVPETDMLLTHERPVDVFSKGAWYDPDDTYFSAHGLNMWCWLDYYDPSKFYDSTNYHLIKTGCSTLGWNKNRHCVGSMISSRGNTYFEKIVEEGQLIPYPPEGGTIRITVLRGYYQHNNRKPFDQRSGLQYVEYKGWGHDERWTMYKLPICSIVQNTLYYEDAEFDDIEISCHVNDYSSDSLDISLTTGTSETEIPTSRAMLLDSATLKHVSKLYRGNYSGTAETLLAGSLYSQYYGRKIKLSGTARYEIRNLSASDNSMSGKLMLEQETADLKQGTSKITYVQVEDDSYEEA